MDIGSAENLAILFRALVARFQEGINFKLPVDLSFAFTDVPSSTKANWFYWLDAISRFREWVGERVWNNIKSNGFEVINRDWEDSIRMKASDIRDDQQGVYAPIAMMMGSYWRLLRDYELIVNVILSNAMTCTGKAFFATDHKYGENTIANKVTGALTETTFAAAFSTAAGWKYANGANTNTIFTHLLVGEKLRATALEIVAATKLEIVENKLGTENVGAANIPNPNAGRATVVTVPAFSGDYDDWWVLLDCSRPLKPITRQIREEAVPKMDTDPQLIEKSGQIDFFASGRAAAAPTLPDMAYAGIL